MSSREWPPHDSDDRYDTYDSDDFDDDDEPSEYTLEEYEDLARQIRSLSNVIWLTGEHPTLSHHPAPPNIDLRSVYRALATLLTRDSRRETVVAVTGDGSTIVDATQFTALVPYRNELDEPHISQESYTGADYAMLDMTPTEVVPRFGDARYVVTLPVQPDLYLCSFGQIREPIFRRRACSLFNGYPVDARRTTPSYVVHRK